MNIPFHTLKAYRGSRSIAPLIFNLDARCEWLISHPSHFIPGKEPLCPLNRRLGGPCAGVDILENRKVSYPYQDLNAKLSSV
jgi:hypothetical protein